MAKSRRDLYWERKTADPPQCTACGAPPAEDSSLCPKHRDALRARVAKSAKKARALRRKRKECAICGAPSPKHYRCAACRIRGAKPGRPNSGANTQDLADRTWKDAGGRSRYHGQQQRGRQSNGQLDAQDLGAAISSLLKAKKGLDMARSPEVQALPKIQRDAAKRAALSQADHGARFVEEVLERNRYTEDLAAAAPRERR